MSTLTLAFAAISGISMVTGHARLTVGASGQVAALLAHAAVHARAVAVTLARWGRDEKSQSLEALPSAPSMREDDDAAEKTKKNIPGFLMLGYALQDCDEGVHAWMQWWYTYSCCDCFPEKAEIH